MKKTLSIIIPCFNEEIYIESVLRKSLSAQLPNGIDREIIIVDDGSTDKSCDIIGSFKDLSSPTTRVKVIVKHKNQGKGSAVREGIKASSGDYIIIQDADLEYDPKDYQKLLQPVLDGYADIVYSSRLRGDAPRRVMFFYHTLGVSFLTFLSNIFTRLNLSDIHSGYKLFKAELLKGIKLKEEGFGFDTEVTAKMSRIKNVHIYEVGISYYGRSYNEGKKIRWTDGIKAIFWTIRYNIIDKK